MSILRGLFLLLVVAAVFTAILHQIVPHSIHTPRRAMETVIRIHDRKAWQYRDSLGDDELQRDELAGNPRATPSPLQALLTAHSLPCDVVSGAVEIPSSDGAFFVTCGTHGGLVRYRVDTRRGFAGPA